MSQRQVVPAWNREKGELLLRLYDKAMHCMDEALELIERGEMVEKGRRLIRAQDIVLLLADALDHQGEGQEVAANLERLYLYIYRLLIRGNNRLDCEAIGEARRLMAKLFTAWEQVAYGVEPVMPGARARF